MSEDDAKNLAEDIKAIFKLTSAFNGDGVYNLFKAIGCKFLDPNFIDVDNEETNKIPKTGTIKLDIDKAKDSEYNYKCCNYIY